MKVAVCACCKNEVEYIAEWVSFHKIVGFDDIYIYDNASTDGTSELLVSLELDGELKRIHWPRMNYFRKEGSYPHFVPQRTAYVHFMQTFSRKYDWVAIIDIDEFIVLYTHLALHELLSTIDDLYPNIASIAVPWLCFGTDGKKNKEEGLVIERFLSCDSLSNMKYPIPDGARIKSIFKPSKTAVMRTHHCENVSGLYADNTIQQASFCSINEITLPVSQGNVLVHHYVTKSEEEFYSRSTHVLGGKVPPHRLHALDSLSILPNRNTRALRHVEAVKRKIESFMFSIEAKEAVYVDADMEVVISGGYIVIIKTIGISHNTNIRVVLNDTHEIQTQNNLILNDGSNAFSIEVQYYHEKIIKISASIEGSIKSYLFLHDFDNYHEANPSLLSRIVIKKLQLTRIQQVKNILHYAPSMERLLFHSIAKVIINKEKFIKILRWKTEIYNCFIVRKELGDLLLLIFSAYSFPERINSFCNEYLIKHPKNIDLLKKYLDMANEYLYKQEMTLMLNSLTSDLPKKL